MKKWKKEIYKEELKKAKNDALLKRKMKLLDKRNIEIAKIKQRAKNKAMRKYGSTKAEKIKHTAKRVSKAAQKTHKAATKAGKKWQDSPTRKAGKNWADNILKGFE